VAVITNEEIFYCKNLRGSPSLEEFKNMIAGIRKLLSPFFESNAGGNLREPQQKNSSARLLPTFFYSGVSPIYHFKMNRSKLIRCRPFE